MCGAKDGPQQELERQRPRWLRKGVGWTALSTGGERGPALMLRCFPGWGFKEETQARPGTGLLRTWPCTVPVVSVTCYCEYCL